VPSPDRPYSPDATHRISPYETRSSGYRSRTDVHSSAPSPQNLTGKRSLTYSVAPFVVELFIARVRPSPMCRPSPSRRGGHTPVPSVARRELPTPAALNELAVASPDPTDGICTRFACRNRWLSAGKRSPRGFASPTRPRPKARYFRIARIRSEKNNAIG